MKYYIYSLCYFFGLLPATYANTCVLSESMIYQQSIAQSDQVQLEKTILQEQANDINDFNTLYDAHLDTTFSHQINQSARTQTIFGTRADTTRFESTYQQNFEAGFSAEAGYRHIREKTDNTFIDLNPAYNSTWFGSISVPLLYSLQQSNRALKESYQGGLDSAESSYQFSKQQIGYSALQTYAMWIQAQEEITLANETLARAKQYLSTTKKLYDSGLVEQSSYFAAQSNVSSRSGDVLATQSNFNSLHTDLTHLLRLPHDQVCSYQEIFKKTPQPALTDYTNNIAQRMDIQAIDQKISSIKIAQQSYRKEKRPTLEAFTSLAINDVDQEFVDAVGGSISTFQPNWTVGGRLRIPFKNTETQTKLKRAAIQINQFQLRKSKALREVKRDIQSTWDTLKLLDQRIEQRKQSMAFERKKIQATKSEYQLGRESFLTLLLYEQDFVQIKRSLLQLQAQRVIQIYLLELLSGQTGFPKKGV